VIFLCQNCYCCLFDRVREKEMHLEERAPNSMFRKLLRFNSLIENLINKNFSRSSMSYILAISSKNGRFSRSCFPRMAPVSHLFMVNDIFVLRRVMLVSYKWGDIFKTPTFPEYWGYLVYGTYILGSSCKNLIYPFCDASALCTIDVTPTTALLANVSC